MKADIPEASTEPELIKIFEELGIQNSYPAERGLPRCYQPTLSALVVTDIDFEGKPFILIEEASVAWKRLAEGALQDSITLQPFSGFRSYRYQANLIKRKLDKGQALDDILKILAVPGYSEHHTGRAIDLTTPGCKPLVEELETTDAFRWLSMNAARFGFVMSFPRDNKFGFVYEPWHWCYTFSP